MSPHEQLSRSNYRDVQLSSITSLKNQFYEWWKKKFRVFSEGKVTRLFFWQKLNDLENWHFLFRTIQGGWGVFTFGSKSITQKHFILVSITLLKNLDKKLIKLTGGGCSIICKLKIKNYGSKLFYPTISLFSCGSPDNAVPCRELVVAACWSWEHSDSTQVYESRRRSAEAIGCKVRRNELDGCSNTDENENSTAMSRKIQELFIWKN